MNRYIIDTHVLLWLIFDPERIPDETLSILRNSHNGIFVTTISFWEISIKYSLGKMTLEGLRPKDIPRVARDMQIDIMDIDHRSMSSYNELPKVRNHKDPFDRILIWHCIKKNICLISLDAKFDEYRYFGLECIH